jgi:hypothetical protein
VIAKKTESRLDDRSNEIAVRSRLQKPSWTKKQT